MRRYSYAERHIKVSEDASRSRAFLKSLAFYMRDMAGKKIVFRENGKTYTGRIEQVTNEFATVSVFNDIIAVNGRPAYRMTINYPKVLTGETKITKPARESPPI